MAPVLDRMGSLKRLSPTCAAADRVEDDVPELPLLHHRRR
jgi:hypothetical protein